MKIFEIEEVQDNTAKIKIVGVGGGGGNAVNGMIASSLQGVEFIAVNTDAQALESSLAHQRIQIGNSLTKGLGAGANPEVGRQAAHDDRDLIEGAIKGADMIFITAGMGGGTGTGASSIVAEVAREQGILTTAVVTRPFLFEGNKRSKNAEQGIKELRKHVDSIIIIHNNRILDITEKNTPWLQALNLANDVLRQAVKGISDLILIPGLINQDFADIKTILTNSGKALMGIGHAEGEDRAIAAAKMAIKSPLLEETSIDGAKGVLINITGGSSLSFHEIHEAASLIKDAADSDAEIIFGSVIDPDLDEKMMLTVIATGFEEKPKAVMTSYDRWRPSRDVSMLRGSHRLLSKTSLKESDEVGEDSYLDVPTFMRNSATREEKVQSSLEK
ncbi:MAG: cell division protein FtsZ [Nitrospiraceae bacterium]|jgi:cell division protein FtsZ|nr:MAG: cell division protein FtsZ [Nitrospiraceae bacterium]